MQRYTTVIIENESVEHWPTTKQHVSILIVISTLKLSKILIVTSDFVT